MQLAVSQSSQTIPPIGQGGIPPLGINAKSADKALRPIPEKPRIARVCKQQAASLSKTIRSEEEKKRSANRRFRHYLAMRQRQEIYKADMGSEFGTLRACGRFAVPAFGKNKTTGEVWLTGAPGEIQLTLQNGEDESRLVHSWVKHCASPLLCFVCAPKIRYYRSLEIQKIGDKLTSEGYKWFFVTFTAPHDLDSDPVEQVKLFQEAKRIFNSQFGRDFKDYWGLRYSIRAVEMTDDAPGPGRKSGCHWHHHEMWFFERGGYDFTPEEIEEIRAFLANRWVNALMKVGICSEEKREAALKHAFRLDIPRRPKNEAKMDTKQALEYLIKGAAIEMTPSVSLKHGKRRGRLDHFDVMRLAFTTSPRLIPRALAIMKALKGRAWLTFSKGLREHCGLRKIENESQDNQEILKEKLGLLVHSYDENEWQDVDRVKGQDVLLDSIVEEVREHDIDLNDLPVHSDSTKRKLLDFDDFSVQKIQRIAVKTITFIAQTGCDPRTGEDLTVDPRIFLPLADP